MNSNGDQKFNKMLGQNTNYLVQTLQPSIAHCTFRDVKYQGTYKSLKGHTTQWVFRALKQPKKSL